MVGFNKKGRVFRANNDFGVMSLWNVTRKKYLRVNNFIERMSFPEGLDDKEFEELFYELKAFVLSDKVLGANARLSFIGYQGVSRDGRRHKIPLLFQEDYCKKLNKKYIKS